MRKHERQEIRGERGRRKRGKAVLFICNQQKEVQIFIITVTRSKWGSILVSGLTVTQLAQTPSSALCRHRSFVYSKWWVTYQTGALLQLPTAENQGYNWVKCLCTSTTQVCIMQALSHPPIHHLWK